MKKYQHLCITLLSLASLLGLGINAQAQYVDPWINPIPIPAAPGHPMIPVVPDSSSSSSQTFPKIFTICNKSKERQVYVAYAYHNGQNWVKEGWRNILRGQCSTLSSNVMSQYVYYYGEGSQGGRWTGDKALCIHPTQTFSIGERPIKDCTSPYILRPFVVVDTGISPKYTINLTD